MIQIHSWRTPRFAKSNPPLGFHGNSIAKLNERELGKESCMLQQNIVCDAELSEM